MLAKIPTPQDIRNAVAAKGWTMTELYRRSGVDIASFWRWEHCKTSINLSTLQALVAALEDDE